MRVAVTENLIDPQIKLDGKWEVALCDISLTDPSLQIETGGKTTTTSAIKKFRKSDLPIMTSITPGHHNSCMILKIQLGEDRLLRMKPDRGINNAETEKEYAPTWTEEIVKVKGVHKTKPITYTIEDLLDEDITGKFYKEQLQKVDLPVTFVVEKIHKRRTRKGVKEALVSWRGYSSKFMQWIPAEDIQDI